MWILCGGLVLVAAVTLRLYRLGDIPYVFDGDEAFLGYYAYSTGNWGIDEFGNRMPIYFPSIGDFKYPTYVYLSVPIVKVLGLTIFSTRLLSAAAGSATVGMLMLLTYIVTHKKLESLLTGLIMAILPWHIVLSRKTLEANLGLFFVVIGVTLFIWGHKRKRLRYIFMGGLMLILAIYSYIPVRIFVITLPVLLIFSSLLLKNFSLSKQVIVHLVVIALIAGATFIPYDSRARSSKVELFASEGVKLKTSQAAHVDGISQPQTPLFITRIFHNKITTGGIDIAKNLIAQLDFSNFTTPKASRDRYKIPDSGLLTIGMVLLAILGWTNLGSWNKKWALLLGIWILGSLVPTAVTNEGADSVRMIMLIPVVVWLIVLGLKALEKQRLLRTGILVVTIFEMGMWWHNYTVHVTYEKPWLLEGEYQHLPYLLDKHANNYKQVALHGDPYVFILFFDRISAVDFSRNAEFSGTKYDWDRVEAWKNIKFKVYGDCPKIGKLNVLYMCKGSEIPQNAKVIELVRFGDGTPAYSLIEFQSLISFNKTELPSGLHYMVETDLRFGRDGLLPEEFRTLTL